MPSLVRMFFVAFAVLVLGTVVSSSRSAHAATLTVNGVADVAADDGQCTLREAITAANSDTASGAAVGECVAGSGADTINFGVTGTITLTSALPDLSTDLTISNTQAGGVTISGANSFRVFFVAGSPTVNINNLTISNGYNGAGAGIYNNGGTLTITDSTISGNNVTGSGGGIYHNSGTLTVTGSTVSNNSAQYGGGIMNSAPMTVTNSTISNNSATSGGGGIESISSFTVASSTVSGNSSGGYGGGVSHDGPGPAVLQNTLVALNTAPGSPGSPDLYSYLSYTSGGHNLIGKSNGSTGFTDGVNNDRVGSAASPIDPLLGPLQNNGGRTATRALLFGSPAIDRGDTALATDQRGFTRPIDGDGDGTTADDIGAFEASKPPLVVTKLADTDDGACDADCSLREAITAANNSSDADTINFGVTGTITLTNVLPGLSTDLTISNTQTGGVTISGADSFRVFFVDYGVTVSLNNLTISNGKVINDSGAGVYNGGGTLNITNSTVSNNSADYGGGGIYNNGGTLTVTDSTVNNNSVVYSYGGGIYHDSGTLTVTGSTFSNNSAQYGGGIINWASMDVFNSTFSGNSADYGGGGICNVNALTVTSSTFSGNTAGYDGGGIANYGSSVSLSNTLIALNTAGGSPDLYSAFTSGGHNLIGNADGSTGFTDGTNNDRVGSSASPVDPLLGPLQNNGGPTSTRALLAGSPAIDRGNTALSTDQRGFTRPIDGDGDSTASDDIGAFEFVSGIGFSGATTATTAEGGAFGFTLTRTGATTDAASVTVTASGTATAGTEYTLTAPGGATGTSSVTVNFAPGETTKTVTVNTSDDAIDEVNETVSLTLSSNTPQTASVSPNTATLTVTDNDAAPSLSVGDVTLAEGNAGTTSFNFTVSLSAPSGLTVEADVASADGTAVAGSDYTALPGVPAVSNVALNKSATQSSEVFGGSPERAVDGDTNGDYGGNSVTHTNGETEPYWQVDLGSVQRVESITLFNRTDCCGDRLADFYVLAAGEGGFTTAGAVTRDLATARAQASFESYRLEQVPSAVGDSSISIPVNGFARYVRIQHVGADRIVSLAEVQVMGREPSLRFAPGETSKTVTVNVNGDTTVEPNETFTVNLSNVLNATIPDGQGVGTITNDDNTAPQALAVTSTTNEDASVQITLTGTDANGDNLTFAAAAPANGTLGAISTPVCTITGGTSNCTATVTYTPNPNFNGADSFTYQVSDGTATSAAATVQVTVTAVNDAPAFTVAPSLITVDEDFTGTRTVTVTPAIVPANESGQTVTYSLSPASVGFANVSINAATGQVSITAVADASGTQVFTITANDAQASNNTATQTFTLTVNAVNDAPVAVNDSYATPTNVALTTPAPGVLSNDTDVDSATRTAAVVSSPANGALTLNADGSFTYTPNLNFSGADSFTYRASDGTATSNTATVQITVNSGGSLSFSAASYTVNEGGGTATITVERGGDTTRSVTVNYATGGTDATPGADYTATSGTLTFAAGVTSQTFTVPVLEDTLVEASEAVTLTLSAPTNGAILGSQGTAILTITDNEVAKTVQFDAAGYGVAEGAGSLVVTVTRSGDTSAAATVDYATTPDAQVLRCDVVNGAASERCDYTTTVGILRFAAGQSSLTITIPVVDDAYTEGQETFQLSLSNAVGVSLGTQTTATLTIQDNGDTSSTTNPIDDLPFFVRQQYLDFLGRQPEQAGFDGWMAKLNQCPPAELGNRFYAQDCTRIDVSSSFFRSREFGLKGYYVYRFYQVSFGERPLYADFIRDMSRVKGATDAEFEANRAAFPGEWVARARFQAKFDAMSNTAFVDELLRASGMTQSLASGRSQWIGELDGATKTRAQVLKEIVESPEVEQRFYNESFVAMQYFGYLRRDPDQAGFDGWLNHLNRTSNYREMVWGFLYAPEHKLRFGPVPGF